jgi:bacillolysin
VLSKGFNKVRFYAGDKSEEKLRATVMRGTKLPKEIDENSVRFNSDEGAARFYLSRVFERDKRPSVRGLSRGPAADHAELVPEMQLTGVQEVPSTKTRLVHFTQTRKTIPIFGSHAVVELDQNRKFVNVTSNVADVKDVSTVPFVSERDALKRIEELTETHVSIDKIQPPELTFFYDDEKEKWHLVYFFRKVTAAPKDYIKSASSRKRRDHGAGLSPRKLKPQINYLIDAEDGTIMFYYSATPFVDVPTKCKGVGELCQTHEFWGRKVNKVYELNDPIRYIKTYDHKGGDFENDQLPPRTVFHNSNDWKNTNKAAISAHVNGSRVYDFFKSVLKRDGIDDKGMDLISIVNVTYSEDPSSVGEWRNAIWYSNRMWYGQDMGTDGKLCSYARFLDIIAHELTHGITQYTSDLVYKNQSGALNESFSDIFGVIINNWYVIGPDSNTDLWNWEIGKGLGENKSPLRDMSNPMRTNDPDHMSHYLHTNEDEGGVHTNSNIHNKAAYNLLTAKDENGNHVFTPGEVALLYYLCLCRISKMATFSDVLEELVVIANTYWDCDEEKIKHIRDAYQRVGIQ